MTTTDSSTVHNHIVSSSQENLQDNAGGANSMPTQAPKGEPQNFIVQSSPEEFDADAKARKKAYHIDIPYNIYQNTFRPNHPQWYQSYLDESRYYQKT